MVASSLKVPPFSKKQICLWTRHKNKLS
uniref:Uncharacterized protein n=1 Tax=Arundo donax TaxID=35708 RepID=A0A0A8ZHV1_ARUDO